MGSIIIIEKNKHATKWIKSNNISENNIIDLFQLDDNIILSIKNPHEDILLVATDNEIIIQSSNKQILSFYSSLKNVDHINKNPKLIKDISNFLKCAIGSNNENKIIEKSHKRKINNHSYQIDYNKIKINNKPQRVDCSLMF